MYWYPRTLFMAEQAYGRCFYFLSSNKGVLFRKRPQWSNIDNIFHFKHPWCIEYGTQCTKYLCTYVRTEYTVRSVHTSTM